MSQSPEPVEPRVIIVPESVREPSIGLEITETDLSCLPEPADWLWSTDLHARVITGLHCNGMQAF